MKLLKKISAVLLGVSLFTGGLVVGGKNFNRATFAETSFDGKASIVNADLSDEGFDSNGISTTAKASIASENDLTLQFGGVNVKNKVDATNRYSYIMFIKNKGFVYSSNAVTDYYIAEVTVTFSGSTGETGKVGISFGEDAITTRNSSVSGAVTKNGTFSAKNSDKTLVHWNISTTNANVQVASISLTYKSVNASDVLLESISVGDITVNPGQTANSVVTFTPDDATNQNVAYEITSGSDVASVDDKGIVTGIKVGTATLTVTPNDTNAQAQTSTINVAPYPEIEGIEVGKKYIMVAGGYELTSIDENNNGIGAAYTDSPVGNLILDVVAGIYDNTVAFKFGDNYLEFLGTDNKIYKASSITANSSWTVATEADNGIIVRNVAVRERLIALNPSNGKFNCYKNFDQTEVSFVEYVEGVELTSFIISETLEVKVGLTATISVTYEPSNASDKSLTWASENPEVATVNNGVVTGVAEGTTTITASKQGLTSQSCTVTVTKIAQHEGTEADPYTAEDAIAVAKAGSDPMKTGKYIKALVTKMVSKATAAQCSFWMGDNSEQVGVDSGAFEAYRLKNITDEIFKLIKVGATVVVCGDIETSGTTSRTVEGNGELVYNSYANANAFAKTFNSGIASICEVTNADGAGTADSSLVDFFSAQALEYAKLTDVEKGHFGDEAKTDTYATDLEKMLATYDYCVEKYTNLNAFLSRTITQGQGALYTLSYKTNNNTAVIAIVVISLVSVTTLGILITLKKRKPIVK